MNSGYLTIDGQIVPFEKGQTIIEASTGAGIYIPHLCHNPDFEPHGSCKVCTVNVNGRNCSACTMPAVDGQNILSQTEALNSLRHTIIQMLFVEGNHFCPGCEKTGSCDLQALGYYLNMTDLHFQPMFPHREVDASHPDILLDRDRCILCGLCVRASKEIDLKDVFALSGRGLKSYLSINSESGLLRDTDISIEDRAVHVCPVGALLVKRKAYEIPIGKRLYDADPISRVRLRSELDYEEGCVDDG
jgi:[NiFe] hydrogenase diaphorase moiety small subunit